MPDHKNQELVDAIAAGGRKILEGTKIIVRAAERERQKRKVNVKVKK